MEIIASTINDISPDYQKVFYLSLLFDVLVTIYASYHWYINNNSSNKKNVSIINNTNLKQSQGASKQKNKDHFQLILRYLSVYLLATTSDWLQGPYIYALYDVYKFNRKQIKMLFCAGYGSGMIFGSFISGMADRCGRRAFVQVYCVVYALSCLTKHVNDYAVLLLGRLLAGIAASLLYSVFEAWFIRAHLKKGLHEGFIAKSFSIVSYSNYIAAIIAGLVSHRVVLDGNGMTQTKQRYIFKSWFEKLSGWKPTIYYGGFLNSFDMAFLCLVLCGVLAIVLWDENYGTDATSTSNINTSHENNHTSPPPSSTCNSTSNYPEPASVLEEKIVDVQQNQQQQQQLSILFQFCLQEMKQALSTIIRNKDVLLCGLISSIFESSMYIFVFNWTPAMTDFLTKYATNTDLESNTEVNRQNHINLPFGLIFSTFMVCCMSGSSLFSILIVQYRFTPEVITILLLFISICCFTVMRLSSNLTITYYSMNIFEICVGIYFPIMGTMKSKYVPEVQRSAIYSLFRIPLNLFVLICFCCDWTTHQSFEYVLVMLCMSVAFSILLTKRQRRKRKLRSSLVSSNTVVCI